MPDVTISDLTAGTTLELTDLFESEITGSHSRKQTTADLRGLGVVPVTTGASPVDVAYTSKLVYITTGGTAGEEIVNLTVPPFDIGTYFNGDNLGQRVTFVLVAQTDPADSVKITVNGSTEVGFYQEAKAYYGAYGYDPIILDFLSASASLVWAGTAFQYDLYYAGNNSGGTIDYQDITLTPFGEGKNIVLQPRSAFNTTGNIMVSNIPTADPMVAGAVWSNLGILTVSAG